MSKYIILNKKKNIKQILNIIEKLCLKNTLKNSRTSIWENDDIQISIDKTIIRILIYSNEDICYYTNILKSDKVRK